MKYSAPEFRATLATRYGRAVALILAIAACGAAQANDANGNQTPPAVVGPNEVLQLGASLVLIVVAILVVGWLYRRAQGMHSRSGEVIQILATQALGPKERVLLVEIAGNQLVLGMTASQIQTLHVLEQPFVPETQPSVPSGFAERLRTAIKGARK